METTPVNVVDAPSQDTDINVSQLSDEIERLMTTALDTHDVTTPNVACSDEISSSDGDSDVLMTYSTCSTASVSSARFRVSAGCHDDVDGCLDDVDNVTTNVESARNGSATRDSTHNNVAKCNKATADTKKRKGLLGFFNRTLAGAANRKEMAAPPDGRHRVATANDVRVMALPQVFLVKYLGMMPCSGLCGAEHVRGPVARLVARFNERRGTDSPLPLIQLHVTRSGINTCALTPQDLERRLAPKAPSKDAELVPIELISFGTQDAKYTRVFCFVVVREISSRSRDLECHVYVCDSTLSARRLALSLSLAFRMYTQERGNKPFEFCVDLRQTAEVTESSDSAPSEKTDCDA